jgi:hypothetical protein
VEKAWNGDEECGARGSLIRSEFLVHTLVRAPTTIIAPNTANIEGGASAFADVPTSRLPRLPLAQHVHSSDRQTPHCLSCESWRYQASKATKTTQHGGVVHYCQPQGSMC